MIASARLGATSAMERYSAAVSLQKVGQQRQNGDFQGFGKHGQSSSTDRSSGGAVGVGVAVGASVKP